MNFSFLEHKEQGFSLTELIVSVALGSIVTLGVLSFSGDTIRFKSEFDGRLQMLDDARRVVRPMADEIRQAQDSSVGDYAIGQVATNTLVIFSDVIDNGYREKIRYFVEDKKLKRGVITPEGLPLSYLQEEKISTLMDNVEGLIFRYYDQSFVGSPAQGALLHPFPTSDVRMIEIEVIIDDDVNKEPNPLGQISMFAQLRNLKNFE